MSDSLVRVTENSPKRCQGHSWKTGAPCCFLAAPDSIYCVKHLTSTAFRAQRERYNQFKLAAFQDQINDQASHSDIKNLMEEVAIVQQCINEIGRLCQLDSHIIQYTPQLMVLIRLSEAMKRSLHTLRVSQVSLLDKGLLMDMVEQTIQTLLPIIHSDGQNEPTEEQNRQSLKLVDDLLSIVASHIGAGNKIPQQPIDVVGFNPRYRIAHWDIHLKAFYSHPNLTDLRGELALTRVILQTHLKDCISPATLLHRFASIVSTLNLIRSLVMSLQAIDLQTGNLLDRGDVLTLASKIAETIGKHLGDDQEKVILAAGALKDVFAAIIPGEINHIDGSQLREDLLSMGGDVQSPFGRVPRALELQEVSLAD